MGRRRSSPLATCDDVVWLGGRPYRCGLRVRPVAEVAAELREYPAKWRTVGVEGWARHARLGPSGDVAWDDRASSDGSYQLAFGADLDLPALALELGGRCAHCARRTAERQLLLQHQTLLGLLVELRPRGRDERAEEEFQLQAVAA